MRVRCDCELTKVRSHRMRRRPNNHIHAQHTLNKLEGGASPRGRRLRGPSGVNETQGSLTQHAALRLRDERPRDYSVL